MPWGTCPSLDWRPNNAITLVEIESFESNHGTLSVHNFEITRLARVGFLFYYYKRSKKIKTLKKIVGHFHPHPIQSRQTEVCVCVCTRCRVHTKHCVFSRRHGNLLEWHLSPSQPTGTIGGSTVTAWQKEKSGYSAIGTPQS